MRSKTTKYLVIYRDENDIIETTEHCAYQEIVDTYPVWKNVDNVRKHFKHNAIGGYKFEKVARKYKSFVLKNIFQYSI